MFVEKHQDEAPRRYHAVWHLERNTMLRNTGQSNAKATYMLLSSVLLLGLNAQLRRPAATPNYRRLGCRTS